MGAVLVCSFGFILYSIFFDSAGDGYVNRSTQIPVQSRLIQPLDIQEQTPEVARPAKSAEQIFIPQQQVTADEALAAAVLDEGKPNAWVIQVGSFSDQAKADEIRDGLISQSYSAYHRQISSSSGSVLHRVLIGPYMNAEEAVRHQREVDQKLDISSLLMKFEP